MDKSVVARLLGATLATLLASSCTHIDLRDPDDAVSGRPTPPPADLSKDEWNWTGLARTNEERQQLYRERESPYYRKAGEAPRRPKVCLALSGGGIRSASFSIGVLEGLEKADKLKDIEVASAVSGGAWALSWFYVQQELALRAGSYDKLTDEGKTQLLTAARSRLFGQAAAELEGKSRFITTGEGIAQGLGDILFIPFNIVVNGFFDNQFNVSPGRYYYESKLLQTYHSSQQFEAASGPVTLAHLARLVRENNAQADRSATVKRLPSFIFNATAEVDDDVMHHGTRLSNTVYEFTPEWLGNDWFGYLFNEGDNFVRHNISDVTRVAAISGAAVDIGGVRNVSPGIRVWWKVLNFGLSENIPNPNPTLQTAHALHHLAPWPLYLLKYHTANPEGVRIRLGDGGFSENWGVYSLVRRGCQKIYVVDAEHDPEYGFEAYHRLKSALKSEMDLDVSVAAIDQKKPAASKLEPTKGVGLFRGVPKDPAGVCSATAPAPVMSGDIHYLPFPDDLSKKGSTVTLHVIKLTLGPNQEHPAELTAYIDEQRRTCEDKRRNDDSADAYPFPQYPTSVQDYEPRDVRAFRRLGNWVVEQYLPKD